MKSLLLVLVVVAAGFQADAFLKDTASNIVSTLVDKISQKPDNNSPATTCECGRPKATKTRIINGVISSLDGPFSSFVQVINTTDHRIRCAGFIVTPLHVITAAHCAQAFCKTNIPVNMAIVAGNPYNEYRTGKTTKYTQKIGVAQVFKADYTGLGNRENDIAVLRLSEPVDFNPMVSRACLPKESEDLGGQIGKIAGWGGLRNDSLYLVDRITEGKVIILSAQKCHKYWPLIPAENPKQICVSSVQSTQQRANEGDSGAPVLCKDEDTQTDYACGILSYGTADRSFNYPRVNTKVAEYLTFINQIVASTSTEQTCSIK